MADGDLANASTDAPAPARGSASRPAVVGQLVQRLREVIALIGFTRFEAVNPTTDGELDLDVEPAALDLEPTWLPAVEHKGEGIFISFRQDRITAWLQNEHVKARGLELMPGLDAWCKVHKDTHRVFPGLPYILLHSLSHLRLTRSRWSAGIRPARFANAYTRATVPSGKWLEFEGGVISDLFNQPGPALSRRRRSRHDDG